MSIETKEQRSIYSEMCDRLAKIEAELERICKWGHDKTYFIYGYDRAMGATKENVYQKINNIERLTFRIGNYNIRHR